jgi:hypothetical protein
MELNTSEWRLAGLQRGDIAQDTLDFGRIAKKQTIMLVFPPTHSR